MIPAICKRDAYVAKPKAQRDEWTLQTSARLLRDGMQLLVGYLASVRAGWEDDGAPIH
jgi:hypothetical protein